MTTYQPVYSGGMIRAAVPMAQPANTSGAATSLISSLQTQQEKQRADAEKQYAAILKRFQKVQKAVKQKQQAAVTSIENLGTAARTRVGQQAQQAQAQATQNLISRGLGNTTVTESARRGIAADQEQAMQSIDELVGTQTSGLLQTQANQLQSLGGLGIDTALSRQNVSPDMSAYLQLIQNLSSLSV